jgi:hypothetical protein
MYILNAYIQQLLKAAVDACIPCKGVRFYPELLHSFKLLASYQYYCT